MSRRTSHRRGSRSRRGRARRVDSSQHARNEAFGWRASDAGMRIAVVAVVVVLAACRPTAVSYVASNPAPCMFDPSTLTLRTCTDAAEDGYCYAYGDACGPSVVGSSGACLYDPVSFDYRICEDLRDDGVCYRYGSLCNTSIADACVFDGARYRHCELASDGHCETWGSTCAPTEDSG